MLKEEQARDLLRTAYTLARNSPDPSTQNGAVLIRDFRDHPKIIGRGCNTFPYDLPEERPSWLERPLKYLVVEHAERAAILDAARRGKMTDGATMVCPWFACADCARAIIGAGIRRVIGHRDMMDKTPDHWKESIAIAMQMLQEAGVETTFLSGKVFSQWIEGVGQDFTYNSHQLRFNGDLWVP